ncbi:MAG: hypothetical protein LBT47_12750 [Deltaproteobacteria bacterium]|jgi:hypothetical protein|nr:hypothetical protein [Deltaproteobacteria bacterium]
MKNVEPTLQPSTQTYIDIIEKQVLYVDMTAYLAKIIDSLTKTWFFTRSMSRILKAYDRSIFELTPSFTVVTLPFEKAFSQPNDKITGEISGITSCSGVSCPRRL